MGQSVHFSIHNRLFNFKALNLHLFKQSPQAVHLSGYFTTARIPASFLTISSTRCEHLLAQRPHPVQLLSTTPITLFRFFRRR
jgi:hypothetical protein